MCIFKPLSSHSSARQQHFRAAHAAQPHADRKARKAIRVHYFVSRLRAACVPTWLRLRLLTCPLLGGGAEPSRADTARGSKSGPNSVLARL